MAHRRLLVRVVTTHALQHTLELTGEALRRGVISTASHGTHAGGQAMLLQPLTHVPTRLLDAPVGMEDDLLWATQVRTARAAA